MIITFRAETFEPDKTASYWCQITKHKLRNVSVHNLPYSLLPAHFLSAYIYLLQGNETVLLLSSNILLEDEVQFSSHRHHQMAFEIHILEFTTTRSTEKQNLKKFKTLDQRLIINAKTHKGPVMQNSEHKIKNQDLILYLRFPWKPPSPQFFFLPATTPRIKSFLSFLQGPQWLMDIQTRSYILPNWQRVWETRTNVRLVSFLPVLPPQTILQRQ